MINKTYLKYLTKKTDKSKSKRSMQYLVQGKKHINIDASNPQSSDSKKYKSSFTSVNKVKTIIFSNFFLVFYLKVQIKNLLVFLVLFLKFFSLIFVLFFIASFEAKYI